MQYKKTNNGNNSERVQNFSLSFFKVTLCWHLANVAAEL